MLEEPSDEPRSRLSLLWYSRTIPACPSIICSVVRLSRELFLTETNAVGIRIYIYSRYGRLNEHRQQPAYRCVYGVLSTCTGLPPPPCAAVGKLKYAKVSHMCVARPNRETHDSSVRGCQASSRSAINSLTGYSVPDTNDLHTKYYYAYLVLITIFSRRQPSLPFPLVFPHLSFAFSRGILYRDKKQHAVSASTTTD